MGIAPTVAIIDDDDGVCASLSSLVRSLGYCARRYESAVQFLNAEEAGEPACLITDVQMPAMTGVELQTALIASGRRIPMIFLTAFPIEETRVIVMAAGAIAHLTKPVDGETIAQCLAAVIRPHPSPNAPLARG